MLRPTVGRPVCHEIKYLPGAYDQILITVRQSRVCWCGAFSLTRGRVCRLQLLLLALANAIILGSESLGTRDHILLSQIRDCPFRHLLRLAGLRWRYSIPPPHGWLLCSRAEQSRSLLPAISRHGHSWHRAPVGPVAIYLLDVETFVFFFLLRWSSSMIKALWSIAQSDRIENPSFNCCMLHVRCGFNALIVVWRKA
jgi:hypothetical protein